MPNQLIYKIIEFELLCSIVSPEQVVLWADEQILDYDETEEALLELCVANSEEKQLKILGNIDTNLENEAFELVAIELLKRYELGLLDFFELTNKLLVIHYHSSKLSPVSIDFIIWLDDEVCLITEGIKELEPAKKILQKFLAGIVEKHNKPKHADLVKLSPFLFQKSRQLHQSGV
ncbi:hypothetical protein HUF18_06955 [Thalassolituus sp. ST750PaO-4]|uniref:hypothetical protein n=1 Tax=Thalassolituus sp. ST750PaO-4 TaxID=2742965 RepID=UPI001CE24B52|nr:hypothetical protein [Thalassolituus sp. ST750PaO-4]MCA6059513.1 hypothetical protein [Thalassolituus sp. ST750PaO-4]